MNLPTYYFLQDTLKGNTPILEQPRIGFGEEFPETTTDTAPKHTKHSPFSTDIEAIKKEKELKKKKKLTDHKKTEDKVEVKKTQESGVEKTVVIPFQKNSEKVPKDSLTPVKTIVSRDTTQVLQQIVTTKKAVSKQRLIIAKNRNYVNQDGIFFLFLIIGLLFGWINVFHRKRFVQVINAFFITRYINQLIREENALLQRVFVMVSIIFILVLSIFAFQGAEFYGFSLGHGNRVWLFMICALGVSTVYLVKLISLNFAGFILNTENSVKEYFYNILLINNFIGILLVPIILLVAYFPQFDKLFLIKAGIFLYLGAFVYRIIRGMFIGMSVSGYSFFHIFLYFCNLEILPFLIIVKLITSRIV